MGLLCHSSQLWVQPQPAHRIPSGSGDWCRVFFIYVLNAKRAFVEGAIRASACYDVLLYSSSDDAPAVCAKAEVARDRRHDGGLLPGA